MSKSTTAARRVHPAVPRPGIEIITNTRRRAALDALAELADAAAGLENPDLFHRPRVRRVIHPKHVSGLDPADLAARVAAAAEARAAAGLAAVASVRAECAERPGRRPCFDPDSLAELHTLLVSADPNIPDGGGLRRTTARVTWADGRRFVIAVPAGPPLRAELDRWYAWSTTTDLPPLDAAAQSMVWLMTIHPFADGNGRTARLLAQCDLVAAGLLGGLSLDLEGWVHGHRTEFDEAVVAAARNDMPQWGELFARMVTDTAQHRAATMREYHAALKAIVDMVPDSPVCAAILHRFRAAPAVSLPGSGPAGTTGPDPSLARLAGDGTITPHPRLEGAWIAPRLLAILDAPYPQESATPRRAHSPM